MGFVVQAQEADSAAADTDSSVVDDSATVPTAPAVVADSSSETTPESESGEQERGGEGGAIDPADADTAAANDGEAEERGAAGSETDAMKVAHDDGADPAKDTAADVSTGAENETEVAGVPVDTTVGALIIRTEPSGAAVIIDGMPVGSTPVKVEELAAGKHRLQISAEGYFVKAATVLVRGGTEQEVALQLVQPGRLTVLADTDKAVVRINGQRQGKTPVTLTDLKPGDYEVRVELDGASPFVAQARIESGENDTLIAQFRGAGQPTQERKETQAVAQQQPKRPAGPKKVAMIVALAIFGLFASVVLVADVVAE
jgi:hypothetical protein